MVTKVVTENDVDNVTIIINPQNKLEAKIPNVSTTVEVEEIDAKLYPTFDKGLVVHRNDINMIYPLQKLGRIKGTEWLVIRLDESKATPDTKRTIDKNIRLEFYDDAAYSMGGYHYAHTGKIRVFTDDGHKFTPDDGIYPVDFQPTGIRMTTQGATERRVDFPTIDFESMTYTLRVGYGDPQASSTLIDVSSSGASFTVEREDAIYRYNIEGAAIHRTPAPPSSDEL